MSLSKLRDWLEIAGLFGVFGGLAFVGVQLRQDEQVALIEGVAVAAANRLAWAELVNDNYEVWVRGLRGDEPLTREEAERFEALAYAFSLIWFDSWNRASRISTQRPERFVMEYGAVLSDNPGLLRWETQLREQLRTIRQRTGEPEAEWTVSIHEEASRLLSDRSTN